MTKDTATPTTTAKLLAIDEAWIARFAEWNLRTFGPGMRTAGTLDHIRKECREIEADPHDPKEWVDIILLAINGLVRQGRTPAQIITEIHGKHEINEGRVWPDWRSTDPEKAIEHNRSADTHAPAPHVTPLSQDVINLIIAAREVAYSDPEPETLRALDKAVEAFAERVPWDNDPENLARSEGSE